MVLIKKTANILGEEGSAKLEMEKKINEKQE